MISAGNRLRVALSCVGAVGRKWLSSFVDYRRWWLKPTSLLGRNRLKPVGLVMISAGNRLRVALSCVGAVGRKWLSSFVDYRRWWLKPTSLLGGNRLKPVGLVGMRAGNRLRVALSCVGAVGRKWLSSFVDHRRWWLKPTSLLGGNRLKPVGLVMISAGNRLRVALSCVGAGGRKWLSSFVDHRRWWLKPTSLLGKNRLKPVGLVMISAGNLLRVALSCVGAGGRKWLSSFVDHRRWWLKPTACLGETG